MFDIVLTCSLLAKEVMQRCCSRRNLDSTKCEFFLENGFSVSVFAPMSELCDKTIFLTETKQFEGKGRTNSNAKDRGELRDSLFLSSSGVETEEVKSRKAASSSTTKNEPRRQLFKKQLSESSDLLASKDRKKMIIRPPNLSKLKSKVTDGPKSPEKERDEQKNRGRTFEGTEKEKEGKANRGRTVEALISPRDPNCVVQLYVRLLLVQVCCVICLSGS
jgi:hypothetical protein